MAEHSGKFPHPLYEDYVLKPFFRDAQVYYYEPMLLANRAHVIMLAQCGIITRDNARALLAALGLVEAEGLAALAYQSGVEDLFFAMERRLIEIAGAEFGGNLQLARSRNDLGYALTRLSLRPLILKAIAYIHALRQALLDFAEKHLHTLMPGYTHTQPAQPTTMAHYIAGMCACLERDTARLQQAHRTNNQSPLGAAALTGTGFPIDRALSARLLGFDRVMTSTWDSIAASDNLTDVAAALTSLGINLSRFTHDMLFRATRESGAIRIDDSFIQISSIMPQKRNPVVLEHLRARISRMLSYTQGIVIQCHNIPFGDTQDIEDEIFPVLFGSLETSFEILHLYTAVIETLHVNVPHLREQAVRGFTTVTELADSLVRSAGLPFRQAHHIVSGMVSHALKHGLSPQELTAALLGDIAQEVTGRRVDVSDDFVQHALDPEKFVLLRSLPGGSAPAATGQVIATMRTLLSDDEAWFTTTRQKLEDAKLALEQAIAVIV
jgi:argininosuccinate lyase